jgi:hypothetical protein
MNDILECARPSQAGRRRPVVGGPVKSPNAGAGFILSPAAGTFSKIGRFGFRLKRPIAGAPGLDGECPDKNPVSRRVALLVAVAGNHTSQEAGRRHTCRARVNPLTYAATPHQPLASQPRAHCAARCPQARQRPAGMPRNACLKGNGYEQ